MTKFSDINRNIVKIYDDAVAKGSNEHERVCWYNPTRQYDRFEELCVLIGDVTRPNLRILDVGCGNAEFLKMLNSRGFCGSYHGIDLHAGLIAEAKQRFPEAKLEQRDLLTDPPDPVDIAVMSGIFNVEVGQSLDYVNTVISAAFSIVREKVIFNAISTYVNRRDASMYYFDPADAIALAAKLSRRFELRHGFLPFNYTVCIHRQDLVGEPQ